jgi:hypothetical protein
MLISLASLIGLSIDPVSVYMIRVPPKHFPVSVTQFRRNPLQLEVQIF